ncbi:hypothetical protein OQA88_8830 [Cercophora sp. LCS_1]
MAESTEAITPIASIQSLQLDLPPSCVEFCPKYPSYFLVGTYNLQKDEDAPALDGDEEEPEVPGPVKTQNRTGSIVAFRLSEKILTHIQTEPQPSAILDLRFNPNEGHHEFCAVVSSTATLAMFRLCPEETQPLEHLKTMSMADMVKDSNGPAPETDVLFLQFCWHPSKADLIAVSTSSGGVYLVSLGEEWVLHPEPVTTHSLEPWCVAISPSLSSVGDGFTLFSGGDDAVLRYRACNCLGNETDVGYTFGDFTQVVKRHHDAGVTAILPLGLKEDNSELVVTGSYDDHIRLFCVGETAFQTKKLAESNLGGGVWRLKVIGHQEAKTRILASCMHAGARIVDLVKKPEGQYEFRVVGSFVEHESMNYGCDFQVGGAGGLSIVSTSFYDKLLCLWEPSEP